jgi:hypothetical protein
MYGEGTCYRKWDTDTRGLKVNMGLKQKGQE